MPEEWELCLDSWLLITRKYLMLPDTSFILAAKTSSSLVLFLVSYVKNRNKSDNSKSILLRKQSFLLMHRTIQVVRPLPADLAGWDYLTNLSLAYHKSAVLSRLLENHWEEILNHKLLEISKATLIKTLERNLIDDLEQRLLKELALIRTCFNYGQFLMIGSDLIDTLSTTYEQAASSLQKKIISFTYFSLMSLIGPDPKTSALLDQLYSLKTTTLLKAIIGGTPFLSKVRSRIPNPNAGRAKSIIESLAAYDKAPDGRPKRPVRRKLDKGKGRDNGEHGHSVLRDVHVHKLSLVSQVQDLFPDLGSAFIIKLLDEYDDDTVVVTDHLLNDSLPSYLEQANRSEELSQQPVHQDHDLAPNLAPHSTPPLLPTRRNIHDDDDFDRLAIDASMLHLGKRKQGNADQLLSSERPSSQKAAILAALAAFDSDDDERDDTYDVEDVGGTVDTTNDDNADDLRREVHEETLFRANNMTPDVFNRDADTRRGRARIALRRETGMTDEAIEGWAIMIGRDPRKLKRLEAKFETFGSGQSKSLQSTAWRADSETEGTEDSDAGRASGGGGAGRGRGGRGKAPGGRGGNVAGPADDKETQIARQMKDANKRSRANHNRRDGRVRKMARGGFPG
ncbi:hypothetical protein MMC21_001813 [Puttea exsequens]|nr:hypothetical protein [Puttea exsequens]